MRDTYAGLRPMLGRPAPAIPSISRARAGGRARRSRPARRCRHLLPTTSPRAPCAVPSPSTTAPICRRQGLHPGRHELWFVPPVGQKLVTTELKKRPASRSAPPCASTSRSRSGTLRRGPGDRTAYVHRDHRAPRHRRAAAAHLPAVVASILASLFNEHILGGDRGSLQDTNDHVMANLQKDGSYSVCPAHPRRRG